MCSLVKGKRNDTPEPQPNCCSDACVDRNCHGVLQSRSGQNSGRALADHVSLGLGDPLQDPFSAAMAWLIEDAAIGPISFTEVTLVTAWLIEQLYDFVLALLADGIGTGQDNDAQVILPAIN